MPSIRTGLAIAALILGSFVTHLQAQSNTASLYGTVLDSGGAVVPGATVRARHVDTGTVYRFTSDALGAYDFPQIRLGGYEVDAEAAGFQRLIHSGINLTLDQRAKLDLILQIGNLTETIQVRSEAPLLETATAATGQAITKKQVEDLPVLTRIPWYLGLISAGVNPQRDMSAASQPFNRVNNFSVNGSRGDTNEMMIDGLSAVVPEGGSNGSGTTSIAMQPTVDATQEFKIHTNSFAAEFGKTGGGVVTLTIKSGTNSLHGSLFEFLQNDKLNANDWFSNRGGFRKGELRRNQFGGSVGGPVIKNRTFFFFDYQGMRQVSAGQPTRSSLPTLPMMNGDFSDLKNVRGGPITIYDPTTAGPGQPRDPFPGNIIPKNRFDPTSTKVATFLPTNRLSDGDPFTHLGNNTYLIPRPNNLNQYDIKFDNRFNDANTVFFRYSWYHNDITTVPTLPGSTFSSPNPADNGVQSQPVHSYQAVVGHTWTINPTTIFDWRGGYTRLYFDQHWPGGCLPGQCATPFDPTNAGFPAYIRQFSDTAGFPSLTFTDYNALGAGNQQVGIPDTILLEASLTKIKGRHVLKFGFDGRRVHYIRGGGSSRNGAFAFDAGFTQRLSTQSNPQSEGNSWASFLLGTPATGSITRINVANVRSQYFAFFAQDDYKISSKVTLNLGLRWDVSQPMWDSHNAMSFLDLGAANPIGPLAGLPNLKGGEQFANLGPLKGVNDTMTIDWNNFAPRVGIAYQVTPKWVVRAGFGVFYKTIIGEAVPPPADSFAITTPMVTSLDGSRPSSFLSNPFPNGIQTPSRGALGLLTNVGNNISGIAGTNSSLTPYVTQWNLNIQRQLNSTTMMEVGYSGSAARKLDRAPANLNELSPDIVAAMGNRINQLVPNPFYGLPQIPSSSVLAQPNIQLGQLLRPYPQFLNVTMFSFNGASADYHSFQAKVEKRFSHGISLLASYVNSKTLDDYSGIPNWLGSMPQADRTRYNYKIEKAVNEEEVPQRFVLAYTVELPFGRGHALLNRGGILNAILGGWQTNGIVTFSAGTPIIVTTSNNYMGFGAGPQRPNSVGRSALKTGDPESRLGGISGGTWFDTSAFSQPAAFTIGNAPRTLPDVRTDTIKNWDMSLFKSFTFKERFNLQYRAELFNFLNTPTFSLPQRSFVSSDFGVISATLNMPRQVQMGLRMTF